MAEITASAILLLSLLSYANGQSFGYPHPGQNQNPTSTTIMEDIFFKVNDDWQNTTFDYIVIGTGFCGYAFVARILEQNPHSKILMLERGSFFLPTHFQALPLAFQQTVIPAKLESYPWSLSKSTNNGHWSQWIHGVAPFFGGRSTKWSGWCPEPTEQEMTGWPAKTIKASKRYYQSARKLLNVTSADVLYGSLQQEIMKILDRKGKEVSGVTRVIPAPLSMQDDTKFSVVGPLLSLIAMQKSLAQAGQGSMLSVAINCLVTRIEENNGVAVMLHTSKGLVQVGSAKLILATGAIPAATLVVNSFPNIAGNIGSKLTTHLISAVTARIPRRSFNFSGETEIGAFYLAGVESKTRRQFHIQASVIAARTINQESLARRMPDVLTTASEMQLKQSRDQVLFVFAILGEQSNNQSWLKKNVEDSDPTTNVLLQVVELREEFLVWDAMEMAAFQVLEDVFAGNSSGLQYFSDGAWSRARPSKSQTRRPGLVHEASTMYIGEHAHAAVDLDYKLRGTDNVYVTGGALWPSSGSWNPTLTMVALSQHLADKLEKRS